MTKENILKIFVRDDLRDHWDVWNNELRLCKIRGEKNNYCVYPDHGHIPEARFNSLQECFAYVTSYYLI